MQQPQADIISLGQNALTVQEENFKTRMICLSVLTALTLLVALYIAINAREIHLRGCKEDQKDELASDHKENKQ